MGSLTAERLAALRYQLEHPTGDTRHATVHLIDDGDLANLLDAAEGKAASDALLRRFMERRSPPPGLGDEIRAHLGKSFNPGGFVEFPLRSQEELHARSKARLQAQVASMSPEQIKAAKTFSPEAQEEARALGLVVEPLASPGASGVGVAVCRCHSRIPIPTPGSRVFVDGVSHTESMGCYQIAAPAPSGGEAKGEFDLLVQSRLVTADRLEKEVKRLRGGLEEIVKATSDRQAVVMLGVQHFGTVARLARAALDGGGE